MSTASTQYDVSLRYIVDDRASASVRNLDSGLRASAASSSNLANKLGGLGAMVAGVFGVREAGKALIGFNQNMEDAKNTIAGLFQLNEKGTTFADNMGKAEFLVGRFQERAKASVGTTADMVAMASALAQPLSAVGATLKQNEDIVVSTVVASKAMGIAAEVAARDIDQALRGQFHVVDQFSSKILGPLGFVGEEGRARFNQMSAAQRFATVNQALSQKAIADMAKAQETSFSGVFSTLQDNIGIAVGKIGLPLFKEITAEIRSWNQWLESNGESLSAWGHDLGKSLVTAFRYVREVAGFLFEHREALLTVAKIWAGVKLAGFAGSAISGTFGSLGALGGNFAAIGAGTSGVASGLGAFGTSLVSTTANVASLGAAALTAGMLIGNAFGEWANKVKTNEVKADILGPNLLRNVGTLQKMGRAGDEALGLTGAREVQGLMLKTMGKSGLLRDGRVDVGSVAEMLSADRGLREQFATQLGMTEIVRNIFGQARGTRATGTAEEVAQTLARYLDPIFASYRDSMVKPPDAKKAPSADKPKVNVTIQRIEVATDDPDRFVMSAVQMFRRVAANPGQARRTLREGF